MAGRTADTLTLSAGSGDDGVPAVLGGGDHVLTPRDVRRIALQVKARRRPGAAEPDFEEHEHPRDARGRFIPKGGTVSLRGGGTGEVTSVGGGKVEVTKTDGTHVTVNPKDVTVTKTPEGQQVASPPPAAPVQSGLGASIDAVYASWAGLPEAERLAKIQALNSALDTDALMGLFTPLPPVMSPAAPEKRTGLLMEIVPGDVVFTGDPIVGPSSTRVALSPGHVGTERTVKEVIQTPTGAALQFADGTSTASLPETEPVFWLSTTPEPPPAPPSATAPVMSLAAGVRVYTQGTEEGGEHVEFSPDATGDVREVAGVAPSAAGGFVITFTDGTSTEPIKDLMTQVHYVPTAAPDDAPAPAGVSGAIGAVYGDHGDDIGKAVDAVYGTVTPDKPEGDDLTEAEQIAVKQKWKLPTGDVADLQAQLAAVEQVATPSVTDLIDSGMDADKAAKEAKRLARNAQVNAWRARTKLQAAIDKAIKADKKTKPSGAAKVAAAGAADLPDTPSASAKLVQPPSGPPTALYDMPEITVAAGDLVVGDKLQFSGLTEGASATVSAVKPSGPDNVLVTLDWADGSSDTLPFGNAASLVRASTPPGGGAVPPTGTWFDVLLATGDKDSAAVPVHGLTIDGHKIQSGWAQVIDGKAFLVETKPGEQLADVSARMFDAAKTLHESLAHLPPESRVQTRAIALLVAKNPNDAYWNEVNGTAGAHSLASGGNGSIVFWGGQAAQHQLIAHEHGHNLDAAAALSSVWFSEQPEPTVPGQVKSWQAAMAADRFTAAYFKDEDGRFKETRPGVHKISLDGKGVTTYGAVNTKEDFAESVRLYIKDKREGKLGFNPSAIVPGGGTVQDQANVRFADLFPERAKVLDAVLGLPGASEIETPHKKRQKATLRSFYIDQLVLDSNWVAPDDNVIHQSFGLAWGDHLDALSNIAAEVDAKVTEIAEAQLAAAKAKAEAEAKAAKAKADAEAKKAAASVKSFEDAFAKGLIGKDEKDKLTGRRRARAYHLRKQGIPADEAMAAALAWEQQVIAEMFGAGGANGASTGPQPWEGKTLAPGIKVKHRKAANDWVTAAGTEVHPQALNQYGAAQQAKANIAAALADRMNNPDDWALFVEYMASTETGDNGHSPKVYTDFEGSTPEYRQAALNMEVSRRIQQWASTSGDTATPAIVMQMAAAEEFGLSAHPAPRTTLSEYEKIREKYYAYPTGAFYRRFLRVQYEHTQAEFAKAGITHVSVYRGMRFGYDAPEWAKADGEAKRPQLQPINSWATSRAQARKFATNYGMGYNAVIFEATVPVELVLGSARTGFGCLNETEIVIMDADGAAKAAEP
jgi:hypothetical protein